MHNVFLREVLPAGYHFVARSDLNYSRHGGVMIASRDNIIGTKIDTKTSTEQLPLTAQESPSWLLEQPYALQVVMANATFMEELHVCNQTKKLFLSNWTSTAG